MTTATSTSTEDLTALDFDITCQVVTWYILIDAEAKPACTRPATHTATVHDFRDCRSVEKYMCDECIHSFGKPCFTCKAPRLTNLRPIPKATR